MSGLFILFSPQLWAVYLDKKEVFVGSLFSNIIADFYMQCFHLEVTILFKLWNSGNELIIVSIFYYVQVLELAANIFKQIPEDIDYEGTVKIFENDNNPINIVLLQEVILDTRWVRVRVMVFNTTFNNFSVILKQ